MLNISAKVSIIWHFCFRIQPEIPGMLRRMMGIDQIFFCQKNVLDMENRKLEITAWNESFDNRVTVEEKCIYYAEGNRTKFSQSAKLKIHSFWGLESTVEKLMITHYKVIGKFPIWKYTAKKFWRWN